MLKIFSYSLGELATNCYVVAGRKNCIIIDPADSPEFIAEEIQRKNLKPLAIIATHGHFDHILGVVGLQLIFSIRTAQPSSPKFCGTKFRRGGVSESAHPNIYIPFWASKKDEFLIANAQNSAQKWLNRKIEEPNPKINPVKNSTKPLLLKTHKAKPPNGLRYFGNKVQPLISNGAGPIRNSAKPLLSKTYKANPPNGLRYFGNKVQPSISNGAGKFLKNKDKIKIDDEILEVIETPGHTPGSICLHNKKNKILFTGDLLFKNGVGRTDFSYADENLLKNSLKKILNLPKEITVYPGHGDKTTIGNEMPR